MTSTSLVLRTHQLPLVADDRRAYVLDFAKSSLFSIGSSKIERQMCVGREIQTVGQVRIEYTGMELRGDDQDVLIGLIHLAKGMEWHDKDGLHLQFTGIEMLREMEWPTTKDYYAKLRDCLYRMQAGSITIYRDTESVGKWSRHRCQLIRKWSEVQEEGSRYPMWHVWLEPEMAHMVAHAKQRVELVWSERKMLKKQISRWLHAFMHASEPDPMRVFSASESEIFKLCGTKATSMRTKRDLVKEGLKEMQATGAIHTWKLQGEFVYVSRRPEVKLIVATCAMVQKHSKQAQASLAFEGAEDAVILAA